MKKFFAVGTTTIAASLGLLILRAGLGLTMLLHHGLDKLNKFSELSGSFPDPLHVGHATSLALAVFAEVAAAGLLALGLLTRFVAGVLAINMAVAFAMVHGMKLGGEPPGELAFVYLLGFVALFFVGPGKFSVDRTIFKT